MKRCPKCKETKPIENFSLTRRKNAAGHFYAVRMVYCKPCRVALNTASAKKYPENRRRLERKSKLSRKYGITPVEYEAQLKRQRARCAICKTDLRKIPQQLVHIDHCHGSGKLRGILCGQCNTGIGSLKDSSFIMTRAIEYVKTGGIWGKGAHA